MAKLVDAQSSEGCGRKALGVRVPFSAQNNYKHYDDFGYQLLDS
jgi:hypothetical protein